MHMEAELSWIHDPSDPYTLRDAVLYATENGHVLVDWHFGHMPYASIDSHVAILGLRITSNRLEAASFRGGRMVGTVTLGLLPHSKRS